MELPHPLILAGLVQPLAALISHLLEALSNLLASPRPGHLPLDPFLLAQEPQASSLEPLLPQASSLEPQLPQADTHQDRAYQDSSLLTLELQDSSPLCQVSSHQVGHPCHILFLDNSPPHLGLHRVPIQTCLTHQVHPDLACTAPEALVPFHQMEVQDMEEECFLQYHQDLGDNQEEAFLLTQAHQEATVPGPWDHTEDLQLQVECHYIDLHIIEHNEQLKQSQEEDAIADPS